MVWTWINGLRIYLYGGKMDSREIELQIDTIANGGDGIGRLADGRAVFIPFTLPGELIQIRQQEGKAGILRGELVQVIHAAQGRIQSRCKHFGTCGGCHFQHMDYLTQLRVKENILRDTLARVGGLTDIPVHPVVPSPQEWNYRNHVQYHLHESGRLGFQRRNSREVIPIQECHLPHKDLDDLRDQFSLDPLTGIERVSVREGTDGELMIVLESNSTEMPEMELDLPTSVIHASPYGEIVLAGSSHLFMEINRQMFKVSAGSFFQVNLQVAGKMVEYILSLLPGGEIACLLDLYCGVGLFSAFIANRVARLVCIESSHSACLDFADNLDRFNNVELYEGSADVILPMLNLYPDTVIADPPRAGLGLKTLDALIKLAPGQIIYVSCDPATMARDAARLIKHGYLCSGVTPFDMFPQTSHIETISSYQLQS